MRFTPAQRRVLLHLADAPDGVWMSDIPGNKKCLHVLRQRDWVVVRYDPETGTAAMLTDAGRAIVRTRLQDLSAEPDLE